MGQVQGEYVSSYFAVPKSKRVPDKWRPILNLKKFNKNIRHIYFVMEEVKCVRKWFRHGAHCAGLDIKDAFLHVPMDAKVKKFLRFRWGGKLYEWQVLPFGLKCSPRILTKMVKPIVTFLRGRGISLTAFMDDFTNQAVCRCKAIFQIHVIALVFMCCGWSVNWTKTILEPTQSPIHLGFLWDTVGRTIALPKDKTTRVESWAKKLLANKKTTQEDLECFVGTLISTTPAVWRAPLHFYSKNKEGRLRGAVLSHVDDYTITGEEEFVERIVSGISDRFTVSKVEKDKFRFTGLDVEAEKGKVEIPMEDMQVLWYQ